MFDQLDDDSITALVGTFYARCRQDSLLEPVFTRAIGPSAAEWEAHLHKVHAFWMSITLGTGSYHGRPMPAHAALPGLSADHFDRWLALWSATCRSLFTPELAEGFITKAERMGEALQHGIALARAAAEPRLPEPVRTFAMDAGD